MKKVTDNYGYRLLVILTAALAFVGFNDYFIQFAENDKAVELFPAFFTAAGTVLLYAVPFAFFIGYLAKTFKASGKVVLLSFILSFTLPLFLGGKGNELISMILIGLKTPQEILNSWGAALTAPFTEEIAKGAVVILVYLLCRGISMKEAFVASIISGYGFQVLEDVAYIFQATFGEKNMGFSIAFERIGNALGSHMAFSVVFGVGLIALIKRGCGISKLQATLMVLAPIILHFAWNSPLSGDWVTPLFGAVNLNLAYHTFRLVNGLDEADEGL